MTHVNVNGSLLPAKDPVLHLGNRAYQYGDGLFETIRLVRGYPCFLDAHWARLTDGLRMLRIELPEGLDQARLRQELQTLAQRNKLANGRFRFTVYRHAKGHYTPQGNASAYTIELEPVDHEVYILNEKGYKVDLYPGMRKQVNPLAAHKTLSGLLYVMAGLWSIDKGLDASLLQNDSGHIIEAASGNMFIVSNGVLYTPPLSDGCVGGIMRMQVINVALENGIKVYESSLTPQNLLVADELFLTNAAQGVQWVETYRTKRYGYRMALQLEDLLVKRVLDLSATEG